MLKFTDTEQHSPKVVDAKERKKNFGEIYAAFDPKEAAMQAARCSQCGIPFCQIHCPLQNNIPDWLKLAAEGRLEEAYAMSSATNNFPEICGRICPQDKLCEGNCVIEKGFKSVTIGAVEKYITETAFTNGWVKPIDDIVENGLSIGIIGAGPAGLAAADMLRRKGYEVHVYDRYDRVGGLMIYGIPNFKLEKYIVLRRHHLLSESGIHFHLNYEIGSGDKSLAALRKKHSAVLIATGVYKAREIEIPDYSLDGVVQGLTYLTASNRNGLGDKVVEFDSGELNAEGKEVVVIGGGDTAMDCVRTAVRQGARKVTCLYRRNRENMPGSLREVKNAEEEGVQFMWLAAPKAFIGKKNINQILVQRMRLGIHDASGRQSVVAVEGESFPLACDMAIKALGFDADDLPVMFGAPELKVNKYGTLSINQSNYMTSLDGVFAAGDIVRGASLVVWAIRDGREAAESMHYYISTTHPMKEVA